MIAAYPIRKPCPACGKPMAAVPDDTTEGRPRYVCANCDDDPLHDPTARKWADGPLRPPRSDAVRRAAEQKKSALHP